MRAYIASVCHIWRIVNARPVIMKRIIILHQHESAAKLAAKKWRKKLNWPARRACGRRGNGIDINVLHHRQKKEVAPITEARNDMLLK